MRDDRPTAPAVQWCPGGGPLCLREPHAHEPVSPHLLPAAYLITVGSHVFYALDDAEREGILARIAAEQLQGRVHIDNLGPGRMVFVNDDFMVELPMVESANAKNSPVKPVERPPLRAEYLLYLCLSKNDRECIPGDLAEEFTQVVVPRFGLKRARLWYWLQVVCSIGPILWLRLMRAAKWTIAAKAVAAIARWWGH